MHIRNIKIENFRNIKKAEINPGEKINFIIGNNAQGKTNFIESIYTSAFLKSFRTNNSIDLINSSENNSTISLEVINNSICNEILFNLNKNSKKIKVNNKKPESNSLYTYLNVIAFHPDEVNYISNYPLFRRNLIDRSIFYTNYKYINIYRKYYRCLKQRNSFLKESDKGIDCWKDQLIKYGSSIIRERLKCIDRMNEYFSSDYFRNNDNEHYSLSYSKEYKNRGKIEDILLEEFERKKVREKAAGYTLTGPHKDDICFYLNDKPAEKFASQGQRRSLVISCKTAQIVEYKAVHGYSPVLILDDMTSELDQQRKNILLENLLLNSGQVFITSTDIKQINCSENSRIFKVKDGVVSSAD